MDCSIFRGFMDKKRTSSEPASVVIDQVVDYLIEQEKEHYTSKLESFASYKEKFRKRAEDTLHQFKDHFFNGYNILLNELKKTSNLEPFLINDEIFTCLNSFEKIRAFLDKGTSLYELFGYSDATLATLYKTAYKIAEERRFQDGYDAYFFIVTIAPHIRDAWLNIGYTLCQLGEHLTGVEAFGRAFELDPTNADSYLASIGAYNKYGSLEKSHDICNLGIKIAEQNKDADWAPELERRLQEAKRYLQQVGG